MSRHIFARPVTCVHSTDIVYSVDDDYSDPSVLPLYACGCRAVLFDMSRMYRPKTPELVDLTSDDVMTIDDILDFVDNRPAAHPLVELVNADISRRWSENYIQTIRRYMNQFLGAPMKGFLSEPNVVEILADVPTIRVRVDWILVVDDRYNNFNVMCSSCYSQDRANMELFVDACEIDLDVDVGDDGHFSVCVDYLPQHSAMMHRGRYHAARFLYPAQGQRARYCCNCATPIVNVIRPEFATYRFALQPYVPDFYDMSYDEFVEIFGH